MLIFFKFNARVSRSIYISLSLSPREGFYVGVDDDETTGDGGGGGSSGISVIFPVGG